MQKWESLNPNKTVWILDLDPTAANTPDSSYGLCVLLALAEKHFRLAVQQFLEHPSFLTVVLTLYPANLRQPDGIQRLVRPSCDLTSLHRIWPHVTQIEKQTHSDRTSALTAISKAGPKIVMANSGTDEAWLSSLVSHWLAV